MKIILRATFLLFSLFLFFYLILPSPGFPEPLQGSAISKEPGDTETPLRRAYFTDLSREEVLAHYQSQFARSGFLGLPLPTYRLNYPPEEAQILVRDQTRSTFLEEVVHPLRESIYVNGFEPKTDNEAIRVEGRRWRQKVTLKYIPSSSIVRLTFGLAALALIYILGKELFVDLTTFKRS